MPPTKAAKLRLADRACQELVRLATTGELAPGQRLTEKTLCRLLKMSRTPVRQALHRLVAEGLFESRPHCGVTVRELTSDDVIGLYLVREAIEAQAMRLAAVRVTPEELRELYDICDRMDALPAGTHPRTIYRQRELDAAFHLRLLELAGVPALTDLYRRQHIHRLHIFGAHVSRLPKNVPLFAGKERLSQGQDHRPIVDALATRDPEKAAAAAHRWVQNAIDRTRQGLKRVQSGGATPQPRSTAGARDLG